MGELALETETNRGKTQVDSTADQAEMEQPNPIRAVIWDLGGVILRTVDYSPREELAARLGMSRADLERTIFEHELSNRASHGLVRVDELWEGLCSTLNYPLADRKLLEKTFWSGDRIDHELLDYIRALRPRFKTALLSNAWGDLRKLLEQEWAIADRFDVIVISAEVGVTKPDPRIYQLVLERLGVSASEAVFIDDIDRNVKGARAAGLQAILFTSSEQVRGELDQLLGAVLTARG